MAHDHRIVSPGPTSEIVVSESGERLRPPVDWIFLPAGDAAITRQVKAMGPTWVVKIRKGRRLISKGIWAKKDDISASKQDVERKRATPEYEKRRKGDLARRDAKQRSDVAEFYKEVISFLNFHEKYQSEAKLLAGQVTTHATPVGSGTVARTRLIPIEERASAAVIAWMRHRTTTYDSMPIARIKGRRREIRKLLAAKSIETLKSYRLGLEISDNCPLKKSLE